MADACLLAEFDVAAEKSLVPDLPVELWAHIMDILQEQRHNSATAIQSHFKGYKVRIGPLRWILRYIRKGRLVETRARYAATQLQARGATNGIVYDSMAIVRFCRWHYPHSS